MLVRLLGSMMPLLPSMSAYAMVSRQISYSTGSLKKVHKGYVLLLLVYNWMLFVLYWLSGMLIFCGVFTLVAMTLRTYDSTVFADAMRALMWAWSASHIPSHAAVAGIPLLVAAVLILGQPTQGRYTRPSVEDDMRFLFTLMYAVCVVTYLLCAAVVKT